MGKRRHSIFHSIFLGSLFALWTLSVLAPPWVYTFNPPRASATITNPAGYFPLWRPPPPKGEGAFDGTRIDFERLLLEWAVIGAFAAISFLPRRQPRS